MEKITAKQILKGFDYAKSDREVFANTLEDQLKFIAPTKRNVQSQETPGDKLPSDIYDDTAIQSNIILAAGLAGYMTNASQRWFELRSRDEALMNEPEVGSFFNKSAEIMYSALANSNFYQQIHECYLDLGSVGTANIYVEEDSVEDVRFYAREFKEMFIVEDDRQVVNMVYRLFELTAYQAKQLFGDKVSEAVAHSLEQKDYGKKYEFIHYVCPRYDAVAGKTDALNLPFASYWVDKDQVKIVKEGGYHEFPFMVTRFYKNTSSPYGYSPGYVIYSDIRMLNKMMETYISGAEISIYPPWMLEHESIIGTLDLRAKALNYQKQPLNQGLAVESLAPKTNHQVTIDFINRTEGNIKAAYFTDLFLMLTQNANMTATEVIQRTQEKMLMLGPVLGRLQNELLSPIILREFNILMRRGKLPPVPEILQGTDIDVIYVSPLAKAQRAVQAQDMNTFLSVVAQMAQLVPTVLDKVDTDTVVDKMGKIYSVDPDIINSDEVVGQIRQQRAEAQAQMNKMAMMEQAVNMGKTGSEMEKNLGESRASKEASR
ncbi:MAG: portal protein [Nanoarchaeota archaeon]|nr:portal protein [Nanoarchaeota archaeon]